jgi:nitrogen fixation NifU-like protein
MYQEIILDHYRKPLNRGLRTPFDAEVHHVNPTCGDEVTLRVDIDQAGGAAVVRDVSYEAIGCSISQAATSVMTELVVGEPLEDALVKQGEFLEMMQSRGEVAPDEEVLGDAIAFAGVSKYPARIKCALLGWMAFKDAAAQAMAAEDASKDTQKETA